MPPPSPPPSPCPARSLSSTPSSTSSARRASKRRRTADCGGDSVVATSAGASNNSNSNSTSRWYRRPSVVWFRGHDLRVEDHPALLAAAQRGGPVAPLFIWDEHDQFGRDLADAKRWWLGQSLRSLAEDLRKLGVQLHVRTGSIAEELENFLQTIGADAVFWNRCYEPELLQRDEELREKLAATGLTAESFKSELLLEPWELSQSDAKPSYNTFHEYMRSWMAFPPPPMPFPSPTRLQAVQDTQCTGVQAVEKLALKCDPLIASRLKASWIPGSAQAKMQLDRFLHEVFPAFGEGRCRRHFRGTSRLSPHVRFGELSPRRMYHATKLRVSRWDHDVPSVTPVSLAVAAAEKYSAKRKREEQLLQRVEEEVQGAAEEEEEGHDELGNENTALQRDLYSEGISEVAHAQQDESADAPQQLRSNNADDAPRDDSAGLSAALDMEEAHDEHALESDSNAHANEVVDEEIEHKEDEGAYSARQRVSLERLPYEKRIQDGACVAQEPNRNGFVSVEALNKETQQISDGDSSRGSTETRRKEKHDREQARVLSVMPHISLSARAFLKNLCLRDFSYHILFHYPDFDTQPLVPEFASFPWAADNGNFERWRDAKTGYPIVDAAMRELRTTGWLHNTMRFLLACFLTKYLLLPWQFGLKEFYKLLLDGDHSANSLGWQWTSGSNTDSFPFSCLVNPVKLANRQDPTGEYVRKWVPELRKLPNKYVHQPWKAPEQILRTAGLTLGTNYPSRVIDSAQARRRAREAMLVMKQVFASMRPSRPISVLSVDDLLRDWPEDSDMDAMDFPSSFRGKLGLLPSLWSLLHCDDPPVVGHAPGPGPDSILGLEAANLAEGALVVPMKEHQESIEHALMTAHNQSSCDEFMASVGLYAQQQSIFEEENGMRNASSRKRKNKECNQFTEHYGGQYANNQSSVMDHEGSAMWERQPPRTSSTMVIPNGFVASNLHVMPTSITASAPHTPENVRLQRPASAQPAQFSQIPTAQTVIGASHAQNASPQDVHEGQNPLQILPQQYRQQQQYSRLEQQRQQEQQQRHQRQFEQQQAGNSPMVFDNLYTTGIQANGAAGVPMTSFPVMMGPAAGGVETTVSNGVNAPDMGHAIYAQQMGMSSFYGYPAVMPAMQGHPGQSLDQGNRDQSVNPSPLTAPLPTISNPVAARQMGFPGSIPASYGIFANGLYDPSVMPNVFPHGEMAQYAAMHMPHQAQPAVPMPRAPGHFSVPPQTLYVQNQPNTASVHSIAHDDGNVPRNALGSNATANGLRTSNSGVPSPHSNANLPAKIDGTHRRSDTVEDGDPGAVVGEPISSGDHMALSRGSSLSGLNGQAIVRRPSAALQPASPSVPGGGRSIAKSSSAGMSSRRNTAVGGPGKRTAAGSKGKGTGKVKKTSNSRGGKPRNGTTANSSGRGSAGSAPLAQAKMVSKIDSTSIASALKARENILASVAEKKDHEYYNFARFLVGTYELTVNTDRHTSKDYVRLCYLKDDYHKQCQSEKEKLKIYRIKTFFSKILDLEVTGEWDRHNHGGVRGPYVYGIREKNKNVKCTEGLGKDGEGASGSGSRKS